MGNKINYTELRGIPILDVADRLGIHLVPAGTGVMAMADPEKPKEPTSLMVFVRTNRWKRFSGKEIGGVSEGSVIDLVMHIRDCELKEAASFLKKLR